MALAAYLLFPVLASLFSPYPPLCDRAMMPPHAVCRANALAAWATYQRFQKMQSTYEDEQAAYALWCAWNRLDAITDPFKVESARYHLHQYRLSVGWERYYGCEYPPVVPSWLYDKVQ